MRFVFDHLATIIIIDHLQYAQGDWHRAARAVRLEWLDYLLVYLHAIVES